MANYLWMVLLSFCSAAIGATGVYLWARAENVERRKKIGELTDAVRRLSSGAKHVPVVDGEDLPFNEFVRTANSLLERTEEELRRARTDAELGRAVLDASPNGLLLVGSDGRIRMVNAAFRKMVEIRDTPEGRTPIEVIPVVEVQHAVDAALRGEPTEEVPCTFGRLDLVLRGTRGTDGGVMLLVQDVTRYRMAERARTEFVANVSHELRTPIATIMGYAETLVADRERLEPETVFMAEAIHRNAHRLRDLFEDLLELSRIEARRRELPLQKLVLAPIIGKAVTAAVDRSAQRKQKFQVQDSGTLSAWVNPEALSTIVGNLANNATNYTPEGGEIAVRAFASGREVVIEVTDNGIGIDRVHHQRIFERFYRVDEGRSRRVGGTGLGLAIVKHLALASGCRVTLSSEIGKGSTFAVHLPMEKPDSVGEFR